MTGHEPLIWRDSAGQMDSFALHARFLRHRGAIHVNDWSALIVVTISFCLMRTEIYNHSLLQNIPSEAG